MFKIRFSRLLAPAAMVLCGGVMAFEIRHFILIWYSLGWRAPVANWLVANGFGDTVAGYWGLVWFHTPNFFVAAVGGAIAGVCVARRWFVASLSFGLAFVLTPDIYFLIKGLNNPATCFGLSVFIRIQCWRVSIVAIAVFLAFLTSRIVRGVQGVKGDTHNRRGGTGEGDLK